MRSRRINTSRVICKRQSKSKSPRHCKSQKHTTSTYRCHTHTHTPPKIKTKMKLAGNTNNDRAGTHARESALIGWPPRLRYWFGCTDATGALRGRGSGSISFRASRTWPAHPCCPPCILPLSRLVGIILPPQSQARATAQSNNVPIGETTD